MVQVRVGLVLSLFVMVSHSVRRDASDEEDQSMSTSQTDWSWTSHCITDQKTVCMQGSGLTKFRLKYLCNGGSTPAPLDDGSCSSKNFTCAMTKSEVKEKRKYGFLFHILSAGLKFYGPFGPDGTCSTSTVDKPTAPTPQSAVSKPNVLTPMRTPRPTPKPCVKKTNVVARHGRLGTQGNKVVDEKGRPVRLRGMSMFWSQWAGKW
eukprot:TRINITY_DN17299_c0_g1_i2.p1 TRINITY_DN17299_c0_g1~~TRINITY_DN17299_c0_g1_i2.p1  ORF type:complete len:238 (+),score=15.51 TRINITY_DN17299_c0_g1_i2:99-716(+)